MVILMKRVEKRSGKPSGRGRRKSKDDSCRKKRVKSKPTVVDVDVQDVGGGASSLPNIHEDAHQRSGSQSDSASASSDIYAGIRSLEELRRLHAAGRFPDAPEDDEKTAQVMAFLRGKEEVLRWEFKMEDPELEEIRVRLYKLNRRKRYIAHAQKMGYSWGKPGPFGFGSSGELCSSSRDSSAGEKLPQASAVLCRPGNGGEQASARTVGPYARKEELQHFMSMKEALNHGYPIKRSNLLACNFS